MPTLAEVRPQYPELEGLDDESAVDALHSAFYSDLPRERVAAAFGIKPPEAPKPKSGLIRRVLGDSAVSLAKGIVGVPEALVGMADLVSGGRAGKAVQDLGFDFKTTKEMLAEHYSPEQKAANEEVNQTKGFFPTIGAMLQNPSTIAQQAIESSLTMLPGAGVARGAMWLGLGAAEKAAVMALPAAERAAAVATLSKVGPVAGGAIGEGWTAAGQNAEQVRQEDPNGTLTPMQSAIIAASGGITGLIGRGVGSAAEKLGIGHVPTMLAQGHLGASTAEGVAKGAGKGVVRRMAEGGGVDWTQEVLQSGQEQAAQNLAQGKPFMDGVLEQAAQGGMAGMAMGAVGAGMTRHPPAPEVAPGAPPLPSGKTRDVDGNVVDIPRLGNEPETLYVFSDGSVGKRADIDRHLGAMSESQKAAARAASLGLAPQPANPRSLKLPEVGPMTRAVNRGLDAEGEMADAGTLPQPPAEPAPPAPLPQPTEDEAKALLAGANERAAELTAKAKGEKPTADGKGGAPGEFLTPAELAEQDFLKTHGGDATALHQVYAVPDAEKAASPAPPVAPTNNAAARAQREADKPGEPTVAMQDGDILNSQGQPFKNETSVLRALAKAGGEKAAEIKVVRGGWVIRPRAGAAPATAAVLANDSQNTSEKGGQDAAINQPVGGASEPAGTALAGATPTQAPNAKLADTNAEAPVQAVSGSVAPAPAAPAPVQPQAQAGTPAEGAGASRPMLAAPAPLKRKESASTKQAHAARAAKLADYFTPGNVVKSYGGHDEVLSYTPDATGGFSVKVHSVTKDQASGQWVRDGKPQDSRQHTTQPEARNLADGPVARLVHQAGLSVPYAQPRADGQSFTNAPDRGEKLTALAVPKTGDQAQADAAFDAADVLGLKGEQRREAAAESLAANWGMTQDEVREADEFKASAKKPPRKAPQTKANERAVEAVVRQAQATPQPSEPSTAAPASSPTIADQLRSAKRRLREVKNAISKVSGGQAEALRKLERSIEQETRDLRSRVFEDDLVDEPPAAATAPAPPSEPSTAALTPKPQPSANTIFTEEAAAAARARLKAKLGRINSGLDPETIMDGITLAGFHIEKGAHTFSAYAKAMVEDLGDAVKPYLKSFYNALRDFPGFDANGMTDYNSVARADLEVVLREVADSGLGKPSADRISMVASLFADLPQRQALVKQGFDGLNVADQRGVLAQVSLRLQDRQVLRAVVQAVPIDVVNVLVGEQLTAKQLLSDPSVLADRLAVSGDGPISPPVVRVINTLLAYAKSKGAFAAAESSASQADFGRTTVRGGTAADAGNDRHTSDGTAMQGDPRTSEGKASAVEDLDVNEVLAEPTAETKRQAQDEIIQLRKRKSVLDSLLRCLA